LQDERTVSSSDFGTNFFITPDSIGQSLVEAMLPRLCSLNSHCTISVENKPVANLSDDFFLEFDRVSYSGFDEVRNYELATLTATYLRQLLDRRFAA